MSDSKTVETTRDVAEEISRGAERAAEAALDEAREELEEVAGKMGDTARRTRREIRRRAEKLGTSAREGYDRAVDGMRKGYEKVRKDAGELTEDVNAYVRENPGKSILIAAGAGFLLGILIRGRRRGD
ncbi:MAG TPA: DUF883 C-terminal domain-containing protein [Thermoanaerobaculia bacterium]|nr:DUF883 C-terminal domain-containing protein [Thermoanaerobaculia bacterium]